MGEGTRKRRALLDTGRSLAYVGGGRGQSKQGTSRRLPNESPDNPRDVFSMEEKKFAFVEMVEFPGKLYADFSLDPVDFSPKWWKNLIREEEEEEEGEEARRRLV